MVSERDRLEHLDRGPEWATVADNRDHLWHISRFYTKEDRAKGLPARALDIATREGKYEIVGLARAQGWRPILGVGGHRADPRGVVQTAGLCQYHPRHTRTKIRPGSLAGERTSVPSAGRRR